MSLRTSRLVQFRGATSKGEVLPVQVVDAADALLPHAVLWKRRRHRRRRHITGTPHQHSEHQYECLGLFGDSNCVIFISSIVNIFMIFHKGH